MNWKRFCVLLVLCIIVPNLSLFSSKDEYIKKAAFIRSVSLYIQWPESSGINDQSKPVVFGVIGENPFGPILESAYSREEYKIKDKKVEIRYISKMEDIADCHILFISKSKEKELEEILAITRLKPIVTIGDTEGFAEKGVLLRLYVSKGLIRFEISQAALRNSPLVVDSELLSIARIVSSRGVEK
ncbi:MAG: YfiR family protein [bacterium]|nr:YfiR family protein [bacterium]